ncbi:MAG: HlyD family efflux transporter periplasmic adaptor subunit [Rhodospirillaceae bacterium]|jgi:HlyD family secretion protein|nr:HlyD family efflux transporter periplasmic adaptor subunit [Rhodospirillaceae bacterium]MBT5245883.1 HlyD family efflux transporter periplasmic adaptor subunit [Rhodospirillaceae bacterium]MBT5562400.1 HlyD family efflux transporter periplasmic adaptor subunit [Rhodospirillaceae bacterium]MBT6241074.1 HlyD family efflux transporter periplasmic adaptor subunit [Rhodospirillaceae bacterium]MBT7138073.1 HlyD family efflux transporter periplasmic adaptor subunit [Rhodospirillaceae bacterium]
MTALNIKKITPAVIAGALSVAVLMWAFSPAPVPVDLAVVKRAPMEVVINGEGRTRVHDIYTVSAPVSGRIRRIEVHVGDTVIAGKTVLASIEPASPQFLDARALAQAKSTAKAAEAAKSLAQAELNRVRAELTFARSNLKRSRDLFAKETISELEFDRAELEVATHAAAVDSALATLKVRRFEWETARAALINPANESEQQTTCCVDVSAPVSGRVLRVLRQSEGVVERASPLIEVGDPENLEVVVDLLSSEAVRVSKGVSVLLNGWGGETSLEGRVRRIEPYGFTKISALGIEEQRVNIIIDFTGNSEHTIALGHGFRVEAHIREWREEDVLQVPIGALFRDGDDWAVFIDNEGTAKLTKITIGHRNGRTAEVLAGLDEGTRVISHPSDRVTDNIDIVARHLEYGLR